MPDLWMDVDAALAEVPVNVLPLIGDTDFKTIDETIAYNESGMDLVWNFVTPAGAMTQTAVTPTTSGDYDWAHQGNGMYSIEITASGGASINNDTEGFGWFTGVCTAVLPWRGPTIGFRAAGLNGLLIEDAYSSTRGLAGQALPDAVAEAAGGLPVSAGGSLGLDTQLANTNEITAARMGALTDWINGGRLDLLLDAIKAVTDLIPDAGALTTISTDTARLTAARAQVLTDWIDAGRLDAILDIIAADVVNIDGDAMRGTNSAALASVCTEARLSELDAATGGKMANQVDEIRTDTGEIGTAGAGLSDLGGMSTGMKAEVNAEVLDTLVTDTHAEPGQGAPGATVSLKDKIGYLYKFLRNKIVQDATTLEVYDDAGTTVDQKATVSDDGTDFTRGEIESGP